MEPKQSRRIFLAAVTFVIALAAQGGAREIWPFDLPRQPQLYIIRGYLDQAPPDAKVADRIEIEANHKRHMLLVTWYGTPGETLLDRYLSRVMARPFSLRGAPEEVSRIIDAPPGTAIEGTFAAYTNGPPMLMITDLQQPAPAKS
jgi:hypothetical protein